jgi:hypothetical protein
MKRASVAQPKWRQPTHHSWVVWVLNRKWSQVVRPREWEVEAAFGQFFGTTVFPTSLTAVCHWIFCPVLTSPDDHLEAT